MLVLRCSSCNVRFKTETDWYCHVITETHQKLARERLLNLTEEKWACIAVAFTKLPVGRNDELAKHLSTCFGTIITDFVWFEESPEVAFLRYDDTDLVKEAVDLFGDGRMSIKGNKVVKLRKASSFKDDEWASLFPENLSPVARPKSEEPEPERKTRAEKQVEKENDKFLLIRSQVETRLASAGLGPGTGSRRARTRASSRNRVRPTTTTRSEGGGTERRTGSGLGTVPRRQTEIETLLSDLDIPLTRYLQLSATSSSVSLPDRQRHSLRKVYRCLKCSQTFSTEERLAAHHDRSCSVMEQSPEENDKLIVIVEGKVEEGNKNIEKNLNAIYSDVIPDPIEIRKSLWQCSVCGKKYGSKSNYLRHYRSIHLKIRYKCKICKTTFVEKSNLQRHKRDVNCRLRLKTIKEEVGEQSQSQSREIRTKSREKPKPKQRNSASSSTNVQERTFGQKKEKDTLKPPQSQPERRKDPLPPPPDYKNEGRMTRRQTMVRKLVENVNKAEDEDKTKVFANPVKSEAAIQVPHPTRLETRQNNPVGPEPGPAHERRALRTRRATRNLAESDSEDEDKDKTNVSVSIPKPLKLAGSTGIDKKPKYRKDPTTGKYKCGRCHFKFDSYPGLYSHHKTTHLGERFRCLTCKKDFRHAVAYRLHYRTAHLGNIDKNKIGRTKKNRFKRKKLKPKNRKNSRIPAPIKLTGPAKPGVGKKPEYRKDPQSQEGQYKCRLCTFKMKRFKSYTGLCLHHQTVHLKVKYQCPFPNCGRKFRQSTYYRTHYRLHHGSGSEGSETESEEPKNEVKSEFESEEEEQEEIDLRPPPKKQVKIKRGQGRRRRPTKMTSTPSLFPAPPVKLAGFVGADNKVLEVEGKYSIDPPPQSGRTNCEVCGVTFATQRSFLGHYNTVHLKVEEEIDVIN